MKIIRIYLLIAIITLSYSSNYVYGQGDDCGTVTNCPNKEYPFTVCDEDDPTHPGEWEYYCSTTPHDNSPPLNPYFVFLPICYDIDESIEQIPSEIEMTGTSVIKVFDRDEAIESLNEAGDIWNCLCGEEDRACQCSIRVRFTSNPREYNDPRLDARTTLGFTRMSYFPFFCQGACQNMEVVLNNTSAFRDMRSGYPQNSFINEQIIEDYQPADIFSDLGTDNNTYNFLHVIVHELGHVLGLDHYDEHPCGGDPSSGLMNSTLPENISYAGLSIDDICMFKKIYCPDLVPVEERIIKEDTDVYNYPNPIEDVTRLTFTVPQKGANVKIIVYNQLGRKVSVPVERFYTGGNYDEQIDLSGLSSGLYYYTVQIDNKTKTGKMVVSK